MMLQLTPSLRRGLRQALLRYYAAHRRDLPWRRNADPYAIWVSEIMLQQTQVDTVVPRFVAFLAQFPSVAHLAAADEADVCAAWAGLGYYRRARHLHAAARRVVAEHGGQLPADLAALQALPGIGRYTAGAIASIAFGMAAPLVDGNVERVLSRLFRIDAGPRTPAGKKALWTLATALVDGPDPGALNQALMELGALVCTPLAPSCASCPVRRHCGAFAAGEPTRYPEKVARPTRAVLPMAMVWAPAGSGVWLAQRPLDGLWAGLWELPSAAGEDAAARLADWAGCALGPTLAHVKHILTHREVRLQVFAARPTRWRRQARLAPHDDPLSAPLSALARKAILAARESLFKGLSA